MHKKYFPKFLIIGMIVIILAYIAEMYNSITNFINNNLPKTKFISQSIIITLLYIICFIVLFFIYKSEKKK